MADFFDYGEFQDLANDLLEEFSGGKTALITKTTGTQNQVSGDLDSPVVATQTVPVVRVPASNSKVAALDERFDTGAMNIKKYAFLKIAGRDLTFDLEPDQKVTMDSEDWAIIGVTPINPNVGNAIVWDVALRI
jgi:hypothetical protein